MLRRRLLLAALPLLVVSAARAQEIAGRPRTPQVRRHPPGFPEYGTLGDREFAQELLQRVRRIWLAPASQQQEFYRIFVARLPQYDAYSWHGLHDELIRLLLTAVAHFGRALKPAPTAARCRPADPRSLSAGRLKSMPMLRPRRLASIPSSRAASRPAIPAARPDTRPARRRAKIAPSGR